MDADWEVEVGGDTPEIDAYWTGYVDLRFRPEQAAQFDEAHELPALALALRRLNEPSTLMWTSKCDVWEPDAWDPDEMDAPSGAGKCALACYVDLLPKSNHAWLSPDDAINWCRRMCSQLETGTLRCCRTDLIIRRAHLGVQGDAAQLSFGVTAYFSACGRTQAEAASTLSSALTLFADSVRFVDPTAVA